MWVLMIWASYCFCQCASASVYCSREHEPYGLELAPCGCCSPPALTVSLRAGGPPRPAGLPQPHMMPHMQQQQQQPLQQQPQHMMPPPQQQQHPQQQHFQQPAPMQQPGMRPPGQPGFPGPAAGGAPGPRPAQQPPSGQRHMQPGPLLQQPQQHAAAAPAAEPFRGAPAARPPQNLWAAPGRQGPPGGYQAWERGPGVVLPELHTLPCSQS